MPNCFGMSLLRYLPGFQLSSHPAHLFIFVIGCQAPSNIIVFVGICPLNCICRIRVHLFFIRQQTSAKAYQTQIKPCPKSNMMNHSIFCIKICNLLRNDFSFIFPHKFNCICRIYSESTALMHLATSSPFLISSCTC